MPLARAKLTEVFVAGVEPGPRRVLIRGVGYGAGVGGGLGAAFVVVAALVSIMGGGVVPDPDLLVLVLIVAATVGAVAGIVFGFIAAACVVGLARGPSGRVRAIVAVVAAVGAATAVLFVFGVLASNDDAAVVVAAALASAAAAAAIASRLGTALTRPYLGS